MITNILILGGLLIGFVAVAQYFRHRELNPKKK